MKTFQTLTHIVIFVTFVIGFFFHQARPDKLSGLGLSGKKLLNLHQLLMTSAFIGVMSEAFVVLKTYPGNSSTRRMIHGVLMALSTVLALFGVAAGFAYKQMEGKPHFHTIHGWIGLLVVVSAILQTSFGAATYWGAMSNPFNSRKTLDMAHFIFGKAIYFGGIVGMLSGLVETQRGLEGGVLPRSVLETYSNVFAMFILLCGALVAATLELPSSPFKKNGKDVEDLEEITYPLLAKE